LGSLNTNQTFSPACPKLGVIRTE